MMWFGAFLGVTIPFLGTTLGAMCVFLLRKELGEKTECVLCGFAGGVMVAASFFSLILPALDGADGSGRLSFIPVSVGFMLGVAFLVLIDKLMPYIGIENINNEKNLKLVLAVTVHNLPEGMAVGIAYAGVLYGKNGVSVMSALALSVGIALQNFPEGAIVSMPLHTCGVSKPKSFLCGVMSGIIEPIGAVCTVFAAGFFVPLMPYFLSFAAGAMFYVVIEELLPHNGEEGASVGTLSFALGFIVMMALDIGMK